MKKRQLIALLLIGLSQVNYGMHFRAKYDAEPFFLRAITNDNVEVVRSYIKNGIYTNCKFKVSGTPIHVAAHYNSLKVARLLLENGANPNVNNDTDDKAPLHYAAAYGFEEMGALLIEYGALLEAENNSKTSPLYYAVKAGKEGVVRLLLEKGADCFSKNNMGEAPYDIASPELKKIIEPYVAVKKSLAFLYGAKDQKSLICRLPKDLQKEIIKHVIQNGCTPKNISEKITT